MKHTFLHRQRRSTRAAGRQRHHPKTSAGDAGCRGDGEGGGSGFQRLGDIFLGGIETTNVD